jgi:hypothetical protein
LLPREDIARDKVAADLTAIGCREKSTQMPECVLHALYAAASVSPIIIKENLREIVECRLPGLRAHRVSLRWRFQPLLQKGLGLQSIPRIRWLAKSGPLDEVLDPPDAVVLRLPIRLSM